MQLSISYPNSYVKERLYIFDVVCKEMLGLDVIYEPYDGEKVIITCDMDLDKKLVLNDSFFQCNDLSWLKVDSLPHLSLSIWNIKDERYFEHTVQNKIPVLYGEKLKNNDYLLETENTISIGVDIFGSAFFMLTRYEEVVKKSRDEQFRFPANASLSWKEKLIMRPIVDEYVEILWQSIHQLWPKLKRKKHDYTVYLSHDVDMPYAAKGIPTQTVIKQIAGDLVKRKNILLAYKRFQSLLYAKIGLQKFDMYQTFKFLMNVSESFRVKSAFYFITDQTAGPIDGYYSLRDKDIEKLIENIKKRGHEVGLHPSYHTFNNQRQLYKEATILKEVMQRLNLDQHSYGGRMHFLRFENPVTWKGLEQAGLAYDSTLGYPEHIGFRCGTCRQFPVYHLTERRKLNLIERPLLVMDQTLLNCKYMNLTYEEALKKCSYLANICRKYNGNFTLLWHNSHLVSSKERELYKQIVKASCKGGE